MGVEFYSKHFIALALLPLFALMAQAQMSLPKTQIGGVEFYRYDTSAGESIYDIAAKLGVTKDFIIKNNPEAADGITNGMTLFFPVENQDASAVNTAKAPSANVHVVEQGETLYGLAKRYGVTIDDLIALNPDAEKGLKIGQKLNIPTSEQKSVNANQQVANAFGNANSASQVALPQGSDPVFHEIKAGEDIYSIAKQYNVTIEGILTANPGLKPNEYTAGAKVKLVPNSALPFIYERTSRRNYKYEVKRGETYASIAAENGITEDELKAANPDLKKVKKGKTITLPKPYKERVTGEMASIPVEELRDYYEPIINDLYNDLVCKRLENELNVAMILPFQLHKSAPPKQAYLYTDY